MSTWYEKAGPSITILLDAVKKKYHPDLVEHNVKVDVLLASSDKGAAVRVRGRACLGCIRVTSMIERTMGMGDALMILDSIEAMQGSERRVSAIIDHELEHLKVMRDRKGRVRRDDIGRPVLGLKGHDYEFGWFERPVEHWGADAVEYAQAMQLIAAARWMQPLLPGLTA